MLWDASVIKRYAIEADDGRLGTVNDFLFEDARWMIRWLVVDTGHWLPGRKVLLPPSALGHPHPQSRRFPVKLTMQQVKDSPDTDTELPVSRQMEGRVYNYYGWDPYWAAAETQFVSPLYLTESEPPEQSRASAQSKGGNPHLRSTAAVTGYHIHATDGQIGHVEDFLVDDSHWNIRYLVVDTRNWWPGEQILISPRAVREIDWADQSIHLKINRHRVKGGRVYDPTRMVDRADEDLTEKYYRRRG
jgi:hypothetical protein